MLQFKVVHRAHLSKMKLSKIYPDLSPNCDKCKSPSASLIQMFGLCPSLEKFWENVFQTLSHTLDCVIKPNPLIAVCSVTEEEGLSKAKHDALSFLAHRTVLFRLKGAVLPTHCQWSPDLTSCLIYRKSGHRLICNTAIPVVEICYFK